MAQINLDLSKFSKEEDTPSLDLSKFSTPSNDPKVDLSIPEDITEDEPVKEEPKKGWLRRGWEAISEPLTNAPSRFAKSIADYVDNPQGEGGYLRGGIAGVTQGIGDVASSLTSPLNLAMLATSGGASLAGKAGLAEVANALHLGSKVASVPFAGHGAYETFRPDSSLAERGMGIAELAGGFAGMAAHAPEIAPKKAPLLPGPEFSDPGGLAWVAEEMAKLKEGKYNQDVRPPGPWESNTNISELPKRTPEDVLFDIAREKHGMGLDLPAELPKEKIDLGGKPEKSFEDMLNTFGGAGHPEAPEYTSRVLGYAENGKPGLSIEAGKSDIPAMEGQNIQHVVYRNTKGEPVGVARVVQDTQGKLMVQDLAINKDKGLLSGRAAKAIGDKLNEMGATEPAGTISPDAINFKEKMSRGVAEEFDPATLKFEDTLKSSLKERMNKVTSEEIPTLYHGTKEVFNEFDPANNQSHGFYSNRNKFTENPEYSELYSLDETPSGMKREVQRPQGNSPNTIAAKIGAKNVLDLTKPLSEEQLSVLGEKFPQYKGVTDPGQWHDILKHSREEIPFDAVRFSEHGQNNWAVHPDVEMKTPSGVPLNKTPELDLEKFGATEPVSEVSDTLSPEDARMKKFQETGVIDDIASADQKYIRLNELRDKDVAGTLTADELKEARSLTKELRNKGVDALKAKIGGNQPPNKPPNIKDSYFSDELDPKLPIDERLPPKEREAPSKLSEIWNASRSLQSVDLPGVTSAALRQSRPLAFTTDWFKAWNTGLKSFGSKEALDAVNKSIQESKYFKPKYEPILGKDGKVARYKEMPSVAEKLGIRMTDVINPREEAIVSSLAERIPGYGRYVKASNRAYTGFLNDLRKAKFEQLMDAAIASGKNPEFDLPLGNAIAEFVNNATGRGSLKYFKGKVNLEGTAAEILGNTMYSPRALSARLSFMNPANYIKGDPMVRKEYWKSLARIGVSWGAFSGLASLIPGVKVSLNPTSSDFGKIKIGNTRIDPGAGFQQLLVLASREAAGGSTSSTNDRFSKFGQRFGSATRLSTAGRYAYNQLHPSLRFVFDMMSASKKEPFDLTDRSLQMVLPMYVTDIAEAAKDDNAVAEFFAPLLSSLGTGVQTYDKGSFGEPDITPFIKKVTGFNVPTMQIGR